MSYQNLLKFTNQSDADLSNIKGRNFRAPLVFLTSVAIIALLGLFSIVYLSDVERYNIEIPFTIIALLSLALVLVLIFFDKLKIAGAIFLTLWISTATIFGWLFESQYNNPVAIGLYALSILIAGLYLNRTGTVAIATINSALVIGLHLAAKSGFRGSPPSGFDEPIIFTIIFFIIAYIFEFTYAQLNKFVSQAETQTVNLERRNSELTEIRESLESTVSSRTEILKRRATLIEAATDVGRVATSIYNLDELLPQVAQLIANRFEYYHVGIFLMDESEDYAVLRAANSEGGRRMIARGLKLKIGEEGIVGHVIQSGEARVVPDINQDDYFYDAPELAETRSEIVLPLFTGGRIFGALDIQDDKAYSFTEEDVTTLRVLADQVAMSINNATLFEQLQNSVEAERRAYGVVGRQAWQSILNTGVNHGYRHKDNKTVPVSGAWSSAMLTAAANQKSLQSTEQGRHTLSVPIVSSDEIIGVMHLKKNAGQKSWGDDEISITEELSIRLSQALDSARLFQETQRQATYQQLTGEVSSKMRETLDIDTVLRTAAQELGEAFKAKEVVIRLNSQKR